MKTPLQNTISAVIAVTAAFALLAPPSAEAQINYQGCLTDATGAPLPDGPTSIAFSLWDDATGGSKVWGDYALDDGADPGHGPKADVIAGRFNVVIGNLDTNNASLTTSLNTDKTFYLQIQVAGNPAITPRQAILAAPRALMADGVRDQAVTRASLIQEVADALCPPGSIMAFAGTTVPSGWLLCDGTALKSTEYLRLSSAIGTSWGDGTYDKGIQEADPTTDFNLPDLRGMFLRGDNGTRADNYKAADEVTYGIIEVDVSSASEADLTIRASEPFLDAATLAVTGLGGSPATIPNGNYSATRINAITWRITGGSGFTIGSHTGLSGTATGSGRRVGSFQADSMPVHRHQWGYHDASDLWTWNSSGIPSKALDYNASNQIPAGSGKDDDWMTTVNVSGGFWTQPQVEAPDTESRPNNAAVNYIIKY